MTEKQINYSDIWSSELIKAEIKEGDAYHPFYLSLTYKLETQYGFYELTIPNIVIVSQKGFVPELMREDYIYGIKDSLPITNNYKVCKIWPHSIKINENEMAYPIFPNENSMVYELKLIKEKKLYLTLKEIEERLGYKIEIISEEEEK